MGKKYELNDEGNARRFVAMYGDRVRWVLGDKSGQWAVYDGRSWILFGADTYVRTAMRDALARALDEETDLWDDTPPQRGLSEREKFRAFIAKSKNTRPIDSALSLAQSFIEIHAKGGDFDAETHLLNFPNGTLNTATLEFREHRSEDMLTKLMPVDFNTEAKAPLWAKFMRDAMPSAEVRMFLQIAVGYAMTGRSDQKMLFYAYGVADTGKSVFCNTIRRMFGEDYAVTAVRGSLRPQDQVGGHNEHMDKMRGRRYVTTSESRPGEPMDCALVKALTGRDEQSTAPKYGHYRQWRPEMTIWVASNQFPRLSGDDGTIFDRIKVVKFEEVFGPGDKRRDEQLEEKLRAELEGIVAWAYAGLAMFNSLGLTVPAEVGMWSEDFRSTADGVSEFLAECKDEGYLRLGDDERVKSQSLFQLFQDWSERCQGRPKHQVMGRNNFLKRLRDMGFKDCRVNNARGFSGVTISQCPDWSRENRPIFGR